MDNFIHQALSNPLILSTIFSYLPTNEIKQCRLVCRDWEDISTPLLGKIAFISINKFTKSLDQAQDSYPLHRPHPLLADKLLFRRLKYVNAAPLMFSTMDHGLLSFISKCRHEIVEEISFHVNWDYYESLEQSLLYNRFRNLKKISIHQIYLDLKYNDLNFGWDNELPVLPTVQTLEFVVSEYMYPVLATTVPCHPFCHYLVLACPNLERLKIQGNFYPCLQTCPELKYLSWRGIPFDVLLKMDNSEDWDIEDLKPRPEFSVRKILGMLTAVKNVLKELELGTTLKYSGKHMWNQDMDELWDEQVPSFPKLVKLSIDKVSVFKKIVDEINPEHFPVLKTLRMTSAVEDAQPWDDFFFKRTDNSLPVIESATIDLVPIQCDDDHPLVNYYIPDKFPNVSQLSLGIWTFDLVVSLETMRLKMFLKDLTRLTNLQCLILIIKGECTTSRLFEFFCENNFVGLKTLKFENSTNVEDGYSYNIPYYFMRPGPPLYEKVFLAFRNVTLQGFSLRKSTKQKMLKFADEHNLHVSLFP